jgi:hypothetical protein
MGIDYHCVELRPWGGQEYKKKQNNTAGLRDMIEIARETSCWGEVITQPTDLARLQQKNIPQPHRDL